MSHSLAVHVAALGGVFRLQAADPVVRAELRRLWGPMRTSVREVPETSCFRLARTPRGWEAWQGEVSLGCVPDLPALLCLLSTHLNSAAITQCSELLVHAGVVARAGRVLALAAESGGGKSTLTAACLSTSWDYVSDEVLCVGPNAVVLPYPKPLALSGASGTVLGLHAVGTDERLVSLDELRGSLAKEPLTLSDVVFLERDGTGRDPKLTALHASEVLTGLLAMSFNHYKRPAASIARSTAAAVRCRAWRLQYTDAREAAALLGEVLPSGPDAARTPVPADGGTTSR